MKKETVYHYPSLDSFKFSGVIPNDGERKLRVQITYDELIWSGIVERDCLHVDAGHGKETIYFADRIKELRNQHGRLYFLCPYCAERVRKLYLYQGSFQCRSCAGLVYPSQYYDTFDRARNKMVALYKKIDPDGEYTAANVLEARVDPPCPDWMSFEEYIKILFEISKLYKDCIGCMFKHV